MADENNIETVETTTPAEIAPAKKRRGPRAKNVATEATAETAPTADGAKAGRGRRKNASRSTDDVALVETVGKTLAKKAAKGAGKT